MTGPALPLRTERLTLRTHQPGDLDRLLEVYGDQDICRYLLFEPWTREEAETQLGKRLLRTDYGGEASALGLVLDLDGAYIGDVVIFPFESQPRTAELGWVLHPSYAGHGYAVEAARELIRIAFEHYDLHRVVANLDGRNTASQRLCERLGMRQEAFHMQDYWSKGEWTDTLIYALLADEWPG
jgi:RimJ/RimL family protein N-acetyltransferase